MPFECGAEALSQIFTVRFWPYSCAASGMAANARIAISIFFILTEVLCATL